MIEAKPYPEEEKRLAAVRSLHLLDSPIEERFERITRMVCRLLDVPISIFNLLDDKRQFYKSVQGLNATNAPLEGAFCTHALHEEEIMLVPDARTDERFHDNPFVKDNNFISVGFYVGCPVRASNGMPVGTLCAIDTRPRELTTEQIMVLRDLGAMIETELKVSSLSQTQQDLTEQLGTANMLAMVDPLTRLWNRAGIYNLLEKEWSEAIRHGKSLTVVMADIDHFKKINDTYGHDGGDTVLRCVSKIFLEELRTEDVIGRVGGEEFLIILTDCDADKAADVVERLRKSMEQRNITLCEKNKINITMSFGVASANPQEDMDYLKLIKSADEALYRAKNQGRNRIETVNA